MREQLTSQAVVLLVGAIVLFWVVVAVLVRRQRRSHPRADGDKRGAESRR